MGIDPATLALISTATSVGSAAFSLIGGMQQSSQAKAQAKYNQQVESNRRAVEEQQQRRQLTLAQGEARARAGGSGATLGSFEDVLNDSQEQGLLDIALGAYDSKVAQQRIAMEGSNAASNAMNSGLSGAFKGLSSAASSYSSYQTITKQQQQTNATKTAAGKLST